MPDMPDPGDSTPAKRTRKRRRRLGVKGKMVVVFAVMGTLMAAGVGTAAYLLTYQQVATQYTEIAHSSAQMAATSVDGSKIDTYLKYGTDPSYYDSYYVLKRVKEVNHLTYLYIIRPDIHQRKGTYIFDIYSAGNDPNRISYLGEVMGKDDVDPALQEAYRTGTYQTAKTKTPEYGYLFSAYVPVLAQDGHVAAVAGADISMGQILKDVYRRTVQISATALGIMTLLLIILLLFVHRRVLDPVVKLSGHMADFASGKGELSELAPVRTGDELQAMSESFNCMVGELRRSMENLEAATADRERIATELNVATEIQASMLPCIFPPFPDREEFDLYATMLPAKEVGGDFYDFFLVDKDTLAVVIADVSGKGVPAALFMVIAKTLIKSNAQAGKSPKEVFETVNTLLCENNEAGMFVTAFMGYLDINSGQFTYVNAGHNPPLLYSDARFNRLQTEPDFVLAGMKDTIFDQDETILHPGDELFLYTDGVTEIANKENRLFGEQRLIEAVDQYADLPLENFVISVMREINHFADRAQQTDDITMLALRYKGGEA